jgi:hypothetical protein
MSTFCLFFIVLNQKFLQGENFAWHQKPTALIVNPDDSEALKIGSADVHLLRPWDAEFDRLLANGEIPLLPFPVGK